VPHGGGFVARTAAEGRTPEELQADLEFLRQVWNDILTRMEPMPAPATLYEDLDLVLRSVRDLVTPELDRIIVDDAAEYERLTGFMRRFMPRYPIGSALHRREPIFDAFGVEMELNRALGRKVWLKSGGYLIIDQTEALTAIDVNTGRFVGKRNLEDTILQDQPRGRPGGRLPAPAAQHRRHHHHRLHRHGAKRTATGCTRPWPRP
jgi:ribonuclease G